MSTSSSRRTVTLRDGARVTLRPIAPEDKPLIAASFERLSEESRYRRFFTSKKELSAAELDYLVDVDHSDHEAIIAVDQLSGEAVGVARYVRSNDDAEVADVAVTVIDDWQGRGLARVLLTRLSYRARREGVRRFSVLVLGENREASGSSTASAMSGAASPRLVLSSSSSTCLPNVESGLASPALCGRRRREACLPLRHAPHATRRSARSMGRRPRAPAVGRARADRHDPAITARRSSHV
jgi:GNAT superfamily N-acetyltransferase